jgi:hypothetical protein
VLIADGAHGHEVALVAPAFETLGQRGTGDSTFAATGVGLAAG